MQNRTDFKIDNLEMTRHIQIVSQTQKCKICGRKLWISHPSILWNMRRPQSSTLSTLSTQEQVLSVELSTTCGNSEAGGGEKASEQDSAPGNLQRCRALLFL